MFTLVERSVVEADSMIRNTDEISFQEYANAKPEYVFIPINANPQRDHFYSVKKSQTFFFSGYRPNNRFFMYHSPTH